MSRTCDRRCHSIGPRQTMPPRASTAPRSDPDVRAASKAGRRGLTLIELVAVLGTAALVAMMATSVLFAMLQQHAQTRSQIQLSTSQSRLARRFSDDVRKAFSANIGDESVSLLCPDGEIRYVRIAPVTIRRTVTLDDAPRSDDFDVTAHDKVTFTIDTLGARKLVGLSITPTTTLNGPNEALRSLLARQVTIIAELSRDYRWQSEAPQP